MQPLNRGKRILVVDDEEMMLLTLERYLTAAGYEVETASTGAAALARLERAPFALVVTDHNMSGMTGAQLATIIKARWPEVPVVMLTGMEPEKPVPCIDLILLKPDEFYLLAPSIQKLLGCP